MIMPVVTREFDTITEATGAVEESWRRLRARKAWGESQPREWTFVALESRDRMQESTWL